MEINERIEKIKDYFLAFNVSDGVAYVIINFPKKWTLFDKETISNEYNVVIEPRKEGIYFMCDLTDGFDSLFDSVDFIIESNKSLEEKTELLRAKVDELQEIFARESLDKLKTLEFIFHEEKALQVESIKDKKPEEIKEKKSTSKTKNKKEKEVIQQEDSELMSFAKEMIETEGK